MAWAWLSAGENREDSCVGCPVMIWTGRIRARGRRPFWEKERHSRLELWDHESKQQMKTPE